MSAAEIAEALDKDMRRTWLYGAARAHYGRCEVCERTRDADDRPLLVARQPRRRKFECYRCWLGLPESLPPLPADREVRGA